MLAPSLPHRPAFGNYCYFLTRRKVSDNSITSQAAPAPVKPALAGRQVPLLCHSRLPGQSGLPAPRAHDTAGSESLRRTSRAVPGCQDGQGLLGPSSCHTGQAAPAPHGPRRGRSPAQAPGGRRPAHVGGSEALPRGTRPSPFGPWRPQPSRQEITATFLGGCASLARNRQPGTPLSRVATCALTVPGGGQPGISGARPPGCRPHRL